MKFVLERAMNATEMFLHLMGVTVYGSFKGDGKDTDQKKNELAFFEANSTTSEECWAMIAWHLNYKYIGVFETNKNMRLGFGHYLINPPLVYAKKEYYTDNTDEMKLIAVYKVDQEGNDFYVDRTQNILEELLETVLKGGAL